MLTLIYNFYLIDVSEKKKMSKENKIFSSKNKKKKRIGV